MKLGKLGTAMVSFIFLCGFSDPDLIQGYVTTNGSAPIAGAYVLPYKYIGQDAVSVGSSFPLGAGYFAPPGEETEGWYIFNLHIPGRAQPINVGPIFIARDSGRVVLPIDGRDPFFETEDLPFGKSSGSYQAGVDYCGIADLEYGQASDANLLEGFVVNHRGDGVPGVRIYPYRWTDVDSVTVGAAHPKGKGYFAPPGEEEAGWYLFDVRYSNRSLNHQTSAVYIGEGSGDIVLSRDGREPFFKSRNLPSGNSEEVTPFSGGYSVGVSYYGGGCATREQISADFRDFAERGMKGPHRWWVNWIYFDLDCSIFNSSGGLRSEARELLHFALEEAGRYRMSLDLTFWPSRGFSDRSAYLRAIENLVSEYRRHKNWFVDVSNEAEAALSTGEIVQLLNRVKTTDSNRMATVSISGQTDFIGSRYADILRSGGRLDLLTPHFARTGDWDEAVGSRIEQLRSILRSAGVSVPPIHLQEEARNGYNGQFWGADRYVRSARNGESAGAAGWIFHTDAAFNPRSGRFFDQLDGEEREFLDGLPDSLN